jgi:hypothetical protein
MQSVKKVVDEVFTIITKNFEKKKACHNGLPKSN